MATAQLSAVVCPRVRSLRLSSFGSSAPAAAAFIAPSPLGLAALPRVPSSPFTSTGGSLGYLSSSSSSSSSKRAGMRTRNRRPAVSMVVSSNTVIEQETMTVVKDGDYVGVHYVLSGPDMEEQDSRTMEDGEPIRFQVGEGIAPKGFEAAVRAKALGERGKVHLASAEAFGEPREDLKRKIPMTNTPDVHVGDRVKMVDGSTAQVIGLDSEGIVLDFNHPLAGKDMDFEFEIVEFLESSRAQVAHFAMGCFWGPQLHFERVPGVMTTRVGYTQGDTDDPTYEQVCAGTTGHTEGVEVVFDPSKVSFQDLLRIFWDNHNPTQLNAQGNDRGTQYRGGVYYHDEEQEKIIRESIKEEQKKYSDPIVTQVLPAKTFWPAEEYHQKYLSRGGRFGNRQSAKKGCDDPVRCYG